MPSSRRLRTTSRASIRFTGKCLPMSRRKSRTDIGPVQSRLLTIRAALSPLKSTILLDLARGCAPPSAATVSSLLRVRSPESLGSPIMPVDPPTSSSGRWPARCRMPGDDELHQVAEVEARRGRVEADIEGDRSGRKMAGAEPLRRWTRPAGHATSVRRARRSRVKCATEHIGFPWAIPHIRLCRPSSASRLRDLVQLLPYPYGSAVPPRPSRLLIEPLTLSTERTSEVRCGEISARSSAVRSVSSSPAASQRRTHAPAISCASANGTRCRTSQSAMSVASENPMGARRSSRSRWKDRVETMPATAGNSDQQLVDRVEDRLLVLLQVTVVGQRQTLSEWRAARSGCRSIVRPCLAPARRRRGSSSAA